MSKWKKDTYEMEQKALIREIHYRLGYGRRYLDREVSAKKT